MSPCASSHLLLLLLVCATSVLHGRIIPGSPEGISSLQLCGLPGNSSFASACVCNNSLTSNTFNCGGGVGIELICEGLQEFYLEDGSYTTVRCLVITKSTFPTLQSAHLVQFPNLVGLDISESELTHVTPGALDGLVELRYLALEDNRLTKFPRIALQNLDRILMSGNMIEVLDNDTFNSVPRLVDLDLSGNRIGQLQGRMFYETCTLTIVDFSHNPLRKIGDEVFEGSHVTHLFLSNTEVSSLPTTPYFRARLQVLELDRVYNFKTFKAQMPGDKYSNDTYPFLSRVIFPYHAHCCQLKKIGFKYRQPKNISRFTNGGGSPNGVEGTTTVMMPTATQVLPVSIVFCVNHTSLECFNDSSTLNISDDSVVSHVTSLEEFCSAAVDVCTPCQGMCSGACATPTGSGSGGGASDISPAGPQVTCFTQDGRIAPSSTTSSLVTISPSPTEVIFTTTVEQTLCPTPLPTARPGPMATVSPYTTVTVTAECTGIPIGPPPCDLCDPVGCCGVMHVPFVNQVVNPDYFNCILCSNAGCIHDSGLPSFSYCNNMYPKFCACIRNPPTCGCPIRSSKRKRSAPFPGDLTLEELDLDSIAMKTGEEHRHKRNKRNAGLMVNCSQDENDVFPVNLDNFSNPVMCQRTIESPPPPVCGIRPGVIRLSETEPSGIIVCSPSDDVFNPCEDLLGATNALRILIWFVIIFAFIGNVLVFVVFIGYSVLIRRGKQDLFVVHFLYFNLAIADFFMCLYLLVIASQDAATRGRFFETDIAWRTGSACEFAGFCAIISTVVSVYILLVITLERTYTIVRVLSHKKLTKRRASLLMLIGWLFGFLIASLPFSNYFSDYNSVAVCLPFNVEDPQSLAYVVILLLGTGLVFVAIAVCYVIIIQQILCNRKKNRPYLETKKRLGDEFKLAFRIFILVFTNFVCWFPIALVGLTSAFGRTFVSDLEFARWAIVFIFPINACINPFLYSLTTRAFRENLILLLNFCGLCKAKAQSIRNAQVGLTPSYSSKTSESSGVTRVRNTVVMRLNRFSLTSQSSMTDLLSRLNNQRRRSSVLSQGSEDSNNIAFLNSKRRHSTLSSDSNKEMNMAGGSGGLGRGRSDSSFSADSDELLINTLVVGNPNFRTSSPEVAKPATFDRAGQDGPRTRCKVSASSLEALPEEIEIPLEVIGDQNVVKANPAAFCENKEGEEKVVTRWDERDSGMVEGSENDDRSEEVEVTPNPTYQLNMEEEDTI